MPNWAEQVTAIATAVGAIGLVSETALARRRGPAALWLARARGRLADLDQVPVRVADIGADLVVVSLGLGEELCSRADHSA
jgi:hypothetical protein